MELSYILSSGIGILQNPQAIDLSTLKDICFSFDRKNGILEINKQKKYKIENGIVCIKIKDLNKGTNTIRFMASDSKITNIIPCQPIFIYNIDDKMQCSLATSIDLINLVNLLQDKLISQEKRIQEIEKYSISEMHSKLNDVIGLLPKIQEKILSLEAGFDPTVMTQ